MRDGHGKKHEENKMNAVVSPNKETQTNTRQNTFVDVPFTLKDGYLLYQPDKNAFIALYPEEWFLIRDIGEGNNLAIEALQKANQAVTEKSLALVDLRRHPTRRSPI